MLSLLASASTPPCSASRSPGASPAAPTIADIAQSTGSEAAASSASGPAAAAMPLGFSASSSSASRSASAVTATSASSRIACRASSSMLPAPVSATTSKVSAPPCGVDQLDGLLADRAGRRRRC